MVDIRQSVHFANYLKKLGWTVERIGEINYFIKKMPIVGSILKLQRPEEIRMDTIQKLSQKYGVFQIVVEPSLSSYIGPLEDRRNLMLAHGFKLSKSTYLPSKTLQIDLTRSKEDILQNFKKDARQAIRKTEGPERSRMGKGLFIKEYSTPDEIKIFREGWKKSVKFDRYVPSTEQLIKLKRSFPYSKSLFLASHNISGRIIGGVIFTTSSHERSNYITYYWQAFTNPEGRSTLSQYSLLWRGILWAKKQGYKIFDFEGIFDPRFPNKSWLGFTHFKGSFGGYEVEYPGCFIKNRLPFKS